MKVILLQNVPNVGKTDEVKEVSDGYARNFLFPRHLAVTASAKILLDRNAHQNRLKKESEAELQREQALAARLDGVELFLKEPANAKGLLYAAVTPVKISAALAQKGFTITKDQIRSKPIKELGAWPAKVALGHGLEVELSIIISPA